MKRQFKFVEKRNFWLFISICVMIAGLSLMGLRSLNSQPFLNFGIDFSGGNTFHLKLTDKDIQQDTSSLIEGIRTALKPYQLEKSQIQLASNNEVYIKTVSVENNITSTIIDSLKKPLGDFEILEIDYIGPSIGKALRKQSLIIIAIVSLSLLMYITLRFQFNFGIAAILALLHDGLIILSVSSLLKIEINTAFIAALLTVLGYSINDTIVIFDRVRERYEEFKEEKTLADITNNALNQTLIRTINTSVTTILVIMALMIFGGSTIREFCMVLLIGILSGTYSSLCIASPLLVAFEKKEEELEDI